MNTQTDLNTILRSATVLRLAGARDDETFIIPVRFTCAPDSTLAAVLKADSTDLDAIRLNPVLCFEAESGGRAAVGYAEAHLPEDSNALTLEILSADVLDI